MCQELVDKHAAVIKPQKMLPTFAGSNHQVA